MHRRNLIALMTCLPVMALVSLAAAPRNLAGAPSTSAPGPSPLVSLDPIDGLERARVQAVASEQPGNIRVTSGVRLSRLVYRSSILGRAIHASALVAVPDSQQPLKGLVIWLRGSDIPRSAAPTTPGAVWLTEAAIYAGNGFAVIVPDYIGMGASPSPQAFLLTRDNVQDFRAALTATHQALQLGDHADLFVTGFSQGGQLSAALHADLEREPLQGFDLRATVSIAGPHELVNALRHRLDEPLASDPTAIGYVAWAAYTYAWHAGVPLDDIFQPRFLARIPAWFGGNMTIEQIAPEFPSRMSDLLLAEFIRKVRQDDTFWFVRKLRDNETFDWMPRAPLRVVIGDADHNVDPASARILYETARTRGGNVGLVTMPGLDHQQTNAAAYAPTLAWFEQLASGHEAPP